MFNTWTQAGSTAGSKWNVDYVFMELVVFWLKKKLNIYPYQQVIGSFMWMQFLNDNKYSNRVFDQFYKITSIRRRSHCKVQV